MAAEHVQYANPSEYISHHLTFATKQVGDGGFWALNVDSIIVSIILGIVGLAFFYWIAKGSSTGVPNKRQAFVEILFIEIDKSVRGIFHGDPNKFVGPVALTVFVWVLLMNAMDLLPVDWVTMLTGALGAHHGFRIVPSADVSTTFALALSVWAMMIYFAIKTKGIGGFIHELFCAPFGANPFLWPLNFIFNLVEYISKPLSHSLRLFGNMYAGEIIFLLLWLMATAGIFGFIGGVTLGVLWGIFHILIVLLQAYIFMMLTIVYIQMGHESH
jgi:F-type H+-transporting ATPase subunit a